MALNGSIALTLCLCKCPPEKLDLVVLWFNIAAHYKRT
jgi:hypothetical protein